MAKVATFRTVAGGSDYYATIEGGRTYRFVLDVLERAA